MQHKKKFQQDFPKHVVLQILGHFMHSDNYIVSHRNKILYSFEYQKLLYYYIIILYLLKQLYVSVP